MENDNEHSEIRESDADAVTPASALEETLEQHLGVFPGQEAPEGPEPSEFSVWPIATAVSVLLIGVGFLLSLVVSAVGAIVLIVALIGWFSEPWIS